MGWFLHDLFGETHTHLVEATSSCCMNIRREVGEMIEH